MVPLTSNLYPWDYAARPNPAPGDMSTSALTMDKVPGDYAPSGPVGGSGSYKSPYSRGAAPNWNPAVLEQMLAKGQLGPAVMPRFDEYVTYPEAKWESETRPDVMPYYDENGKLINEGGIANPERYVYPGGGGHERINSPEYGQLPGGNMSVPSPAPAPAPATGATIDPSQSTLSPNFAPYVYDMLRSAQTAASRPFMPYMGQRFAGSSPLEQQAFRGLGNLQTPWQFGAGSGMAYQAGLGSFTQPNTAEAFMSPYMRNVTDIAKREAKRQSGIQSLQDKAAFTKAGAFGGSRQAIVEAERQRNLAQQMGDIEERGLQSAFDRATQQYNTERDAQLRSAMGLGTLGQQQFGTQMQGLQGLLGAGGTQRQIAQQPLDFGYQQWQESLQYPYKQATFLSSMLAGMPVGASPYRPATDSDSGFGSALQGGLTGLALYNLFNQK